MHKVFVENYSNAQSVIFDRREILEGRVLIIVWLKRIYLKSLLFLKSKTEKREHSIPISTTLLSLAGSGDSHVMALVNIRLGNCSFQSPNSNFD